MQGERKNPSKFIQIGKFLKRVCQKNDKEKRGQECLRKVCRVSLSDPMKRKASEFGLRKARPRATIAGITGILAGRRMPAANKMVADNANHFLKRL